MILFEMIGVQGCIAGADCVLKLEWW